MRSPGSAPSTPAGAPSVRKARAERTDTSEPPPPLQATADEVTAHVREICRRMRQPVRQEVSWEERVIAMRKLHALLLGGVARHAVFARLANSELAPVLAIQLADNRSKCVKMACTVISECSRQLQLTFAEGATSLLPPLLKLLRGAAPLVVVDSAKQCVSAMVLHTRAIGLLSPLLAGARQRAAAPALRCACVQFLGEALEAYDHETLDAYVVVVGDVLSTALADAASEVRSIASTLFCERFEARYPSQAARVCANLSSASRRLLASVKTGQASRQESFEDATDCSSPRQRLTGEDFGRVGTDEGMGDRGALSPPTAPEAHVMLPRTTKSAAVTRVARCQRVRSVWETAQVARGARDAVLSANLRKETRRRRAEASDFEVQIFAPDRPPQHLSAPGAAGQRAGIDAIPEAADALDHSIADVQSAGLAGEGANSACSSPPINQAAKAENVEEEESFILGYDDDHDESVVSCPLVEPTCLQTAHQTAGDYRLASAAIQEGSPGLEDHLAQGDHAVSPNPSISPRWDQQQWQSVSERRSTWLSEGEETTRPCSLTDLQTRKFGSELPETQTEIAAAKSELEAIRLQILDAQQRKDATLHSLDIITQEHEAAKRNLHGTLRELEVVQVQLRAARVALSSAPADCVLTTSRRESDVFFAQAGCPQRYKGRVHESAAGSFLMPPQVDASSPILEEEANGLGLQLAAQDHQGRLATLQPLRQSPTNLASEICVRKAGSDGSLTGHPKNQNDELLRERFLQPIECYPPSYPNANLSSRTFTVPIPRRPPSAPRTSNTMQDTIETVSTMHSSDSGAAGVFPDSGLLERRMEAGGFCKGSPHIHPLNAKAASHDATRVSIPAGDVNQLLAACNAYVANIVSDNKRMRNKLLECKRKLVGDSFSRT